MPLSLHGQRPRRRPFSRAVALTVVGSFGLTGALVPVAAAAAPRTAPQIAGTVDPVAAGAVSPEDQALQQAQAGGNPVEVVSARTEESDQWANPDGTFSTITHGAPVRLWRDGAWVDTDPTLVFTADGQVVPKASTVASVFSGGGTAPLVSTIKDGRTLTLSWPTALPKPSLAANIATYPEVLPGVDLQLKAEVEGYSQVLVVKTVEAAQNPALATLNYKINTVGLNVATDPESGAVTAVDSAGQTLFSSPAPAMWDSTTASSAAPAVQTRLATVQTASAPGDVFEPAPGAKDALMPTTVTGDTLQITPDQPLLKAADTQYPVYIDPQFTRAWGKLNNWTRIYNRYPKNSYWNANDVARVGHENDTNGTSASFFEMSTADLRNAGVIESTFRIKNTWSWSCTKTDVQMWRVKGISKQTTWNNPPEKIGGANPLFTVNDAKGWGDGCPAGNLEFNATSAVKDASNEGQNSVVLGLYAPSLTDTFQWKKFDPKTATLETKYNHPPKTPTQQRTNPQVPCTGGTLGDVRISLLAKVDDEDAGNLTAKFEIYQAGTNTLKATNTKSALKNQFVTWAVPDANLPGGDYEWRVQATDQQGAVSGWTSKCKFSVDRTRPLHPPVLDSPEFPNGDAGWPYATTHQARTDGSLSLGANGIADIEEYNWWTDWDPQVRSARVSPGATASGLNFTPPSYGPHLIYAFSIDKAHNRSDTAVYLFYANANAATDSPNDLNGDGKSDIWSVDSNGTLLSYFGQGNGQFSTGVSGARSFDFSDGQAVFRGDWGKDGYNDLVSLEKDPGNPAIDRLWSYPNNGLGTATEDSIDGGRQELTLTTPANNHWGKAAETEQIIAPGDLNADGKSDLLVKSKGQLWAYYAQRKILDRPGPPVAIGGTDWTKYTVITPGDLNGDTIPDLLLRENASGDILRILGTARKNPMGKTPTLDLASWDVTTAQTAGRVVTIAKALATKAAYPVISSASDTSGDGIADLWARQNDNVMVSWTGAPTTTGGKDLASLGARSVIDGITGGARLPAGTTLGNNQSLTSGSSKLAMSDGVLSVISAPGVNQGKTVWSAGKPGHPDAKAVIEGGGNLAICAPAATTDDLTACQNDANGALGKRLWSTTIAATNNPAPTPNGYALLQDRGNLVVYNARGQSLWGTGSNARHDYNRDGRGDLAALYSHADGSYELYSFLANTDGTFPAPHIGYHAPAGSAWAANMKYATGDYNGDGIGDVAILYGYDNGSVRLFTATGRTDGSFNTPVPSWYRTAGSWWFSQMNLQSGDFNGDGRDDLAVWYDYTDGHDTLFTFTANVQGGFNEPFASWTAAAGNWELKQAKFAIGDYNGDGRDDLGVFYGYGDMTTVKMHTFLTNPTGGFGYTTTSWTSTTWGNWNQAHIQAGDFNGDGRDDIVAWYDYSDGHDSLNTFVSTSSANGSFNAPYSAWSTPAGNYWWDSMPQMVAGDYNGDGRDDLAVMYGYGDGHSRMFTWTAKNTGNAADDGHFNDSVASWTSGNGVWANKDVHFFNTHS